MRFRQDINILRGIAVFLVVIFHFFPSILPNGYLGVDVFFIISGFLISLGILKDNDNNKFSYIDFYKRRIHRIIPAALAMLIVVTAFQIFVLLPSDLNKYASSLEATLFFGANIYFFLTGGYFGGNDAVKPLLHMWSLGIEEQFYIFFPVVFIVSLTLIKKRALFLSFVSLILVCSYILNIYLFKIGGQNPAFFLLPTRLWQFLVGVIAAYIIYYRKGLPFRYKYLSQIGLILIGINLFYVKKSIPDATILSLGIFLIITNSLNISRNLITIFLSFLGKVSFSLYIWHWPIAAFLNYYNISKIPAWHSAIGLALSIGISYISWLYIEEKYRRPVNTKRLISGIAVIYIALIGGSSLIKLNNGLPQRFNADINEVASAVDSNFRCPKLNSFLYGGSKACIIEYGENRELKTAVVGNSHSLMYAPVISKVKQQDVLVVPLNGCTPTYDYNLNPTCLKQFEANLVSVSKDNRIHNVVIGTTWGSRAMVDDKGKQIEVDHTKFNESLLKTINNLEAAGKNVYLIGPIATPGIGNNFASDLSRSLAFGSNENSIKQKESIQFFNNEFLDDIIFWKEKLGKNFIPTYESLCDEKFCYYRREGITYFADDNHLSQQGANATKENFLNSLN